MGDECLWLCASSPLTLPSLPMGRGLRRVGEAKPSLTRSWVREPPLAPHSRKSVPLAAKPFKKDGPLRRISMIAQFESDRMRKEGRNHEPTARHAKALARGNRGGA